MTAAVVANPLMHRPVMVEEVIRLLAPRSGGVYLDGTVGGGGHAAAILEASGPGGRLIGLDVDPESLEVARECLADYGSRVRLHHANYAYLEQCLTPEDIPLHGVLLDLGLSSLQLGQPERGFAFSARGPLDMRFDRERETTALDLLTGLGAKELAELLRNYGEVREAGRLARSILAARDARKLASTVDLARVVEETVGRRHPFKVLAQVFQALRIAVNRELVNLERGLRVAFQYLAPGGRLTVVAYHSLEDRRVKEFFRYLEAECICPPDLPVCQCGKVREGKVLTRRPLRPAAEEVAENPRARSARLRAVAKGEA